MTTRTNSEAEQPGTRAGKKPLHKRISALVTAIRTQDDASVEAAVLELSRSRRLFAPLAFIVAALVMLLGGVKLLFTNWRLTLVQVLPAMWIWFAMIDLKAHVLHGSTFLVVRGPLLIVAGVAIAAITAASFYLNAVFALAISKPGDPDIARAFVGAKGHMSTILSWGFLVGGLLAFSATVVSRWGTWWFALSMSIVVGVMMLTYVTVPSLLVGVSAAHATRRDSLMTAVVGGALGAIVCTPPYLVGRIGILMLGSDRLFILGIVFLVIGLGFQVGATGAVSAIKVSAKLATGRSPGLEGRGAGVKEAGG
jgi:hypothetical protein